MEEEYSIAIFEDGTTEMIPKSWIQDYLKPEVPLEEEFKERIYTNLQQYNNNHAETCCCTCNHQQKLLQYEYYRIEKLLQGMINLQEKNNIELNRLQTSINQLINNENKTIPNKLNVIKQAETLKELFSLEEYIKTTKNYDELVKKLSKIGGNTVEIATRKIWTKLCSNRLASKICWTGANGKHCLKNMLLNQLIKDSVLVTHPQGKEVDIQRTTMLWFSHAQDRLKSIKINQKKNL